MSFADVARRDAAEVCVGGRERAAGRDARPGASGGKRRAAGRAEEEQETESRVWEKRRSTSKNAGPEKASGNRRRRFCLSRRPFQAPGRWSLYVSKGLLGCAGSKGQIAPRRPWTYDLVAERKAASRAMVSALASSVSGRATVAPLTALPSGPSSRLGRMARAAASAAAERGCGLSS